MQQAALNIGALKLQFTDHLGNVINASTARREAVRVEARAPSGRVMEMGVGEANGCYTANFTPTEVGDWKISIMYEGRHIQGSPFNVRVYDAAQVKVFGLEGGAVGQNFSFSADCSAAGQGNLTVEISHAGKPVPSTIGDEGNSIYRIGFTPRGAGIYNIKVFFAGMEITGSPYTLEIVDSNLVTARGEGLSHVEVGKATFFEVSTHGASGGDLKVNVFGPRGNTLPAQVLNHGDGTYRIEYVTTEAGMHRIEVLYYGKHILNSPFRVEAYDFNRINVTNLPNSGMVGHQVDFDIDASQAGTGNLEIMVNDGTIPCSVQNRGNRQFHAVFVPKQPGTHNIQMKFNNRPVPGSPWLVNVVGAAHVTSSGTGLQMVPVRVPATFDVRTGSAEGQVQAVVTGSPYQPKVVDTRKVHVVGGWARLLDSSGQMVLVINEQKRIEFDTALAGPGTLAAQLSGPHGPVACEIRHQGSGRYVLLFTPIIEGQYTLSVLWEDNHLINSPYHGFARGRASSINHDKVILTGLGLREARVHEVAKFVIDGTNAGTGVPDCQMTGVKSNIDVSCRPIGANKYECTYVAEVAGAYLLNIMWSDRQVRGAPFKVNVISTSDASKVIVTGEGLKMGVMGKEIKSTIDTRRAGPGELTAHCQGPTREAYCQLSNNHDGTFTLSIRPQEAGRHILQIQYDSEHVPGSPFTLRISGAPDASKVRVSGPGIEHGLLAMYQSRFLVETRGAGAGQLTVRIRGPKGAFRVEMQRESQKDRSILCRYDPAEVGDYIIHVKWSNEHVPGSPFCVHIADTQDELERFQMQGNFNSIQSARSFETKTYGFDM